MRIALTGSTGLIGSALVPHFLAKRYSVIQISRRRSLAQSQTSVAVWDPAKGEIEADKLEGQDVFIHLAGANISERWTPEYKKLIQSSRVDSTRLLCKTLTQLKKPPKLLISASAVGFYGNRSDEDIVNEHASPGSDFLSQVCQQWEEETLIARHAGIRVINVRTGVVLSPAGGALGKMLPIFNLGLGGVLGDGTQMMSWIALPEIPLVMDHLIKNEQVSGAVNMVTPKPVPNREFTQTLGQVIKRPVIVPVPAFGIKMLFGEMGETLLLDGVGVVPKRLLESGYNFRYPDLKEALEAVINKG